MGYDGIILINKEPGWTSHDVVAKIRSILSKQAGHKIKVGHTGTLDPKASGLMIIVVGSYCKRAGEFSKLDKTYQVTMKLGEASSTGDSEGEIAKISAKKPAKIAIETAIASFMPKYMQTPPAFSAVKINGKRAYKLARQGKAVKIEPRQVSLYGADVSDYAYPFVKFTAKVSSGTYIRSLVEDIGKQLQTGAYMSDLTRTVVGEFLLGDAHKINQLKQKITLLHNNH